MLSRRELVGRLAAGTAAAVCATGVSFAATRREGDVQGEGCTDPGEANYTLVDTGEQATQQAPAPWELLSPLAAGSTVSNGWTASELTGIVDGSCVLTLKNQRGREHRIHVCRNDGSPEGLVYTNRFDLLVMNGGRGDLPTEEGFAQAVAEVAHVLAKNETAGHVEPTISSLMPQAERIAKFSGTADRRLR
jgi:hypothetical protein